MYEHVLHFVEMVSRQKVKIVKIAQQIFLVVEPVETE
jgi:hypothetical protein